jgi:hypothetical protein
MTIDRSIALTEKIEQAIKDLPCITCAHFEVCAEHLGGADLSIVSADCRHHKPAADTVEVVRCKDCRLHEEVEGILGGTCLYCSYWNKDVDPDEFCSKGW